MATPPARRPNAAAGDRQPTSDDKDKAAPRQGGGTLLRRRGWEIPESRATPEALFLQRRALMRGLAAGCLLAAPSTARLARAADAPRNFRYPVERPLTSRQTALAYNNFYEFGSGKNIAAAAAALSTDPWTLRIDGLVERPETLDAQQLIRLMPAEERVYRLRCVEAWAMTLPWTGFPLSALLARVGPQAGARYLAFETLADAQTMPGLQARWYPWPYREGITLAEAANELTFIATGLYGRPLAPQSGAPLRLLLPWKYGFKSIKSIVRITVTAERPQGFWQRIAPSEYGFWANVNPDVPHPRWSQAMERLLDGGERVATRIYNGYGPFVAALYNGSNDPRLFR